MKIFKDLQIFDPYSLTKSSALLFSCEKRSSTEKVVLHSFKLDLWSKNLSNMEANVLSITFFTHLWILPKKWWFSNSLYLIASNSNFKFLCRISCVQLSAAHSAVCTDWHVTLPIEILSKVNHFLSFPVLDLVIVDMRVVAIMFPTEDFLLLALCQPPH